MGFDLKNLQLYVAQSNIISFHSVKIELDLKNDIWLELGSAASDLNIIMT